MGLSTGRGLTGRPGLSRGPEPLLLCCEEVSEPDGLNKFELSCWRGDGRIGEEYAAGAGNTVSAINGGSMGAGVLLLLFDFDFFDRLRASSSRKAISSLALSSSSLVFRRPLLMSSARSNSIASMGDVTVCSMLGAVAADEERFVSVRFKGAGAGLRKDRVGGLGKLPECDIGVASTTDTAGAWV